MSRRLIVGAIGRNRRRVMAKSFRVTPSEATRGIVRGPDDGAGSVPVAERR